MDVLIFKPLIESLTNALSPTAGAGSGLLGALFPAANGAAIDNGNVVPFAYGGVVNSPTMFGMSGGRTGLMGEAGPEAILPLKRGAGGKLGVEGGGNVTVHQSFNFAANGDESVKRIIADAAPGIAKMTEAQIVNSRQRGGQMRRVFS
jgi:lambda family phage tail tape measure protein